MVFTKYSTKPKKVHSNISFSLNEKDHDSASGSVSMNQAGMALHGLGEHDTMPTTTYSSHELPWKAFSFCQ